MSMKQRNTLATVLLIVLLLALPGVAAIQTVWLTSAARGDGDQMRRTLNSSLRQIRTDLSIEMATMRTLIPPEMGAYQPDGPTSLDDLALSLPEFYNAWKEQSRFPGFIDSIVYTGPVSDWQSFSFDVDTQVFEPVPESEIESDDGIAVLVPLGTIQLLEATESGGVGGSFVDAGHIVIRLDRDYLATIVIPQLVDTYMGDEQSDYHVALVNSGSGEILWGNREDAGEYFGALDLQAMDDLISVTPWGGASSVAAALGFVDGRNDEIERRLLDPVVQTWLRYRPASNDEWANEPPARQTAATEAAGNDPGDIHNFMDSVHPGELLLVAFHTQGNIETAAMQGRNRNLVYSYAVLGTLAGAAIAYYLLFRRANRQQEREHEFVATVTHELRTPVAAMKAVADNLSEGIVTKPERVREYGKAMLGESRRLGTMIDQVLLYAGLQGGSRKRNLSELDLDDVVARTHARIRGLRRENLTIRVEPKMPGFRGDATAVESILQNLLSNAVKHNDEGTSITLAIRTDHRGAGLRQGRGGQFNLVIEVSDNGRGIPRKELHKVRDPFFRGARSQENQVPGSGLGLNLVKRIARTYGGSMDVDSVIGEGTTVTVRLPFEHGESDGSEDTDR